MKEKTEILVTLPANRFSTKKKVRPNIAVTMKIKDYILQHESKTSFLLPYIFKKFLSLFLV